MKLLALDTATEACSAAVWVDGTVFERRVLAPRQHTALILPMIEAVLAEAALRVSDIDALAFGCGPGAFTGVRLAVSVAQGIAFAADIPVVPVSTLAALAVGAAQETGCTHIAAAIDARMGEVYYAAYAVRDGSPECVDAERVCAPDQITIPSAPSTTQWIGVGSGWATYASVWSERFGAHRSLLDRYPQAADVAKIAAQYGQAAWMSAEQALPVYLRNHVAVKCSA